jgi:hypothetical protein
MNRTVALTACSALLLLAGCSSGSSGSGEPPAQQLRDLDVAAGHSASANAYTSAFAVLSKHCTEQGVPLANEVQATLGLLKKASIDDETNLTVMQHLDQSMAAEKSKTSCAQIAGAYVTLREGQ